MSEDVKAQAPLAPAAVQAIKRASVRTFDEGGGHESLILYFATADDTSPSWWSPLRDQYLRKFWPKESYLAGAIFSICARNAAFKFTVEGPPRQVRRVERLLNQMGLGAGWQAQMMKISQDLLCQDNGAFIEVIRPARVVTKEGTYQGVYEPNATGVGAWHALDSRGRRKDLTGLDYTVKDSPYDLPLALQHLDAGRCKRTGDPTYPVVYKDLKGVKHKLAYWQVMTLVDMPSPQEEKHDVGYCAVTRVLRLARILLDIQIYKGEKVSGRFQRAIYLTNAGKLAIETALAESAANADSEGLMRYVQPLIVSTLDPTANVSLEMIELASLPDGFSEEETLKWYIAAIALGTGVDYGFLAPLPGRGIGTASESETQARSARGKSSRLFMKMLEAKMNYGGILPRSCRFQYGEMDPEEEQQRDEARERRARTRATRIKSGEITPEVARMLALEDGDLSQDHIDEIARLEALIDRQVVGDPADRQSPENPDRDITGE